MDTTFGSDALCLKRRIVQCGKPDPLFRTMRASDPKVDATFGIHPMLFLLSSASFDARKTGATFPHDALI
jgi:hypothetical protein